MFRFSLTTLSCLLIVFATWADDKDDVKKEQEKFQGEWKLVGQEEVSLKFKGDVYEFTFGGQEEKGKMKFNPKTKPAQVDVDITDGNDAGKKQVGIYEWDGDKVKFCFAQAGETKRPEKFDSSDSNLVSFTFEKVKK